MMEIGETTASPAEPSGKFVPPQRRILSVNDMERWARCQGRKKFLDFIQSLNEAVKHRKLTDPTTGSTEMLDKVVAMLDKLDGWIDQFPPVKQGSRFGNKSYRDWHSHFSQHAAELLDELLPDNLKQATVELLSYLLDSFGNATRIDYGTGHEACFAMFLCCLHLLGLLEEADKAAVVCVVFKRYLELCHKLQSVYMLEPAGSHGSWCLDDYQFLPFYWGSAQLIGDAEVSPMSFPDPEVARRYAKENLFMASVDHINSVKTGPFAEHSAQLWNVSSVSSWSKINRGLYAMYLGEVLGRFPVVQHFVFGSLINFDQ